MGIFPHSPFRLKVVIHSNLKLLIAILYSFSFQIDCVDCKYDPLSANRKYQTYDKYTSIKDHEGKMKFQLLIFPSSLCCECMKGSNEEE